MNWLKKFIVISASAAAFLRNLGSYGFGIVTALGFVGISLSDANRDALLKAIDQVGQGASSLLTGLGTIGTIALGAYAAWRATHAQQTKAVGKIDGVQVNVDPAAAPASVVKVAVSQQPGVQLTQ